MCLQKNQSVKILLKDYQKNFERVYRDLVQKHKILWVPFLLEKVALDPKLNQRDGIHPNAQGHRILADHILKVLLPALSK